MFALVERPALYPGRSLLEAVDGPFVDTGIEMPVGGRVYIDRTSADEIARLLPPPALQAAQRQLAGALAEVAAMQAELARLRPIVEAVREAATA